MNGPARQAELVVIGAGPAGVAAALAANECGVGTVLLDENLAAGGQVFRAPGPANTARDSSHLDGETLRQALAASAVAARFERRVWRVSPALEVAAVSLEGLESWQAQVLVVASGTTEHVVPFPGWTEPGVIGLGAATALLKSEGIPPGRRTLVAGSGPLLAAVAVGILEVGGAVAGVVDLAGPFDWLRGLPALAARPALLARGLGWLRRLRRSRVPIFARHSVRRVERSGDSLVAEIEPLGSAAPGRRIACDALAIGHGLTPASEITQMLRLAHVFNAGYGGWIARRDARMVTSRPDVFVAGDCGGVAGAAAAALQGRIAGLGAAHAVGRLDASALEHRLARLTAPLARAERFGLAFAPMIARAEVLLAHVPEDTIVCRCEDVTRAEITAAIATGAADVNQVKAWTRAGMGPCQGRVCGETLAGLLAPHVGGRAAAGSLTARPPLRPLPLAAMLGRFEYADIPIPPAAPP
jgi:thioredoxin reductase/bacterioferritin-associated ferredoxin